MEFSYISETLKRLTKYNNKKINRWTVGYQEKSSWCLLNILIVKNIKSNMIKKVTKEPTTNQNKKKFKLYKGSKNTQRIEHDWKSEHLKGKTFKMKIFYPTW